MMTDMDTQKELSIRKIVLSVVWSLNLQYHFMLAMRYFVVTIMILSNLLSPVMKISLAAQGVITQRSEREKRNEQSPTNNPNAPNDQKAKV